jgi:hypothetical protein
MAVKLHTTVYEKEVNILYMYESNSMYFNLQYNTCRHQKKVLEPKTRHRT